jgi:sarcosine oxidase gamma subunit
MALSADRTPDDDGLDLLLRAAGAAHGRAGDEPGDYGSAAGELAALTCAVGLAARSQLSAIALEGPAAVVHEAVSELAGAMPAGGGAVVRGESWWCGLSPGQVIVVGPRAHAALLQGRLDWHRARRPALTVRDLAPQHTVLEILGQRAGELLATLGVYGAAGDPRWVAPVHAHRVAGADVLWLLRSDRDALAIVVRGDAPRVWRAVCEAGRPLQLTVVGRDALARYALTQLRPAP